MANHKCDIAIVGGGPAGLAAALTLMRAGLRVMVFEKGSIADHIAQYPTYLTWFSTCDLLELGGMPMTLPHDKPTRQEYLAYLRRFVSHNEIDLRQRHEVTGLEGREDDFTLHGLGPHQEPFSVACSRVILATGAYALAQMLGVPGEDLPKVSHHYREPHPYFGSRVLVVGGRNSAVETALELWRAGVEVRICHRAAQFQSVKYWLEPDIENRIRNGQIKAHRPARVLAIFERSVLLREEDRPPIEVENDFVLAMTGYRSDPQLLDRFGVETDRETGRPICDPETLETRRPGLYLAGVIVAGNVSSAIFIENSRFHGEKILAHLTDMRLARV